MCTSVIFFLILLIAISQTRGYAFNRFSRGFHNRIKFESKVAHRQVPDVLTPDTAPKDQFITAKELSSLLKINAKDILSDITMKHNKHWYSKFDGVWHEYESLKDIVIPLSFAAKYAVKMSRPFPRPLYLNDLQYYPPAKVRDLKVPIVVVLGHFNHGKTSLIDHYCDSNIAENEVHSITQVVRSRLVTINDVSFTFIDTPGQEIFYRMRNAGASIADAVLLVIAADTGVCKQTEECIGILESLNRPVIVCINKIDKPEVTKERIAEVERDIRQFVALEKAVIVPISTKSEENIDKLTGHLIETLRNITSSREWKGSDASAGKEAAKHSKECVKKYITGSGSVLNLVRSRQNGTMLHVLVQQGQVRVGDSFSSGGWSGWVREVVADNQESVSSAAAGRGVYLKVGLQERSSSEPRPLGHRVFFHWGRDRAKVRQAAQDLARFRQLERLYHSSALSDEEAEQLWLERTAARVARKKFELNPIREEPEKREDDKEEHEETESETDGDEGETETEEEEESEEEEEGSPSQPQEQLVLIKADSDLSLETILDAHFDAQEAWSQAASDAQPSRVSDSKVPPRPMKVVRSAVGDVTLSDVTVAQAAGACIVTYGVGCDGRTAQSALRKGVTVTGFECLQDAISLVTSHFVRPTHYQDFTSMMIRPKRRSSLFD